MNGIPENPNLKRRAGPGLLVQVVAPFVKPLLWLFKKQHDKKSPLVVFQSYMVGDLFMALPAMKTLAAEIQICVICRPDCLEILRSQGLKCIPFENRFFVQTGIASFFGNFLSAWKLRGKLGNLALDFDADPRTAFWLKIAGVERIVSYRRSGAAFFDCLLPMPMSAVHQSDKNHFVVSEFLNFIRRSNQSKASDADFMNSEKIESLDFHSPSSLSAPSGAWIISCWTRKDTKNWPLDRWNELLNRTMNSGMRFQILNAPDGDAVFKEFLARWSGKVEVLKGSLAQIAQHIQVSKGIITTDNFTGHMAAYYHKPVLWINGSSDPLQVMPRGTNVQCAQVEPMPCRPCGHHCVNAHYKLCLTTLEVHEVWKKIENLLIA